MRQSQGQCLIYDPFYHSLLKKQGVKKNYKMWTPLIQKHRSFLIKCDEAKHLLRYELVFFVFLFFVTIFFQSHVVLALLTMMDFFVRSFFDEWHNRINVVMDDTNSNTPITRNMGMILNFSRLFSQCILYGNTALLMLMQFISSYSSLKVTWSVPDPTALSGETWATWSLWDPTIMFPTNARLYIFAMLVYQSYICGKSFLDTFTIYTCDMQSLMVYNSPLRRYGMITVISIALINIFLAFTPVMMMTISHAIMVILLLHSRGIE